MENKKKARVIAFYLPQFHPIPENDNWWGKGFTEWTNVGKAKPLFRGHYQPRVPADLGYYDLRLPEVREQQAAMALEAGIEGFCYWHYWFGNGRQLLERPFNDVLESGRPDFPFCLGWGNHPWTTKTWDKGTLFKKDKVLMEQTYPGEQEHIQHFYAVLKAFKDKRYICVDEKPIFLIIRPLDIPDVTSFILLWNRLAVKNGLKGIHFVGIQANLSSKRLSSKRRTKHYLVSSSEKASERYNEILNAGFDAVNSRGTFRAELILQGRFRKLFLAFIQKITGGIIIMKYYYGDIIKHLYVDEDSWENVYPTILPNWDRTARSGKKAVIYHKSSPKLFQRSLKEALEIVSDKEAEHKILFLMSWNEWAEGNYVEPDIVFGKGYLNALREELFEHK